MGPNVLSVLNLSMFLYLCRMYVYGCLVSSINALFGWIQSIEAICITAKLKIEYINDLENKIFHFNT